ncbi:hypothetical protein C8J57DRAFT_1730225 [Mycena rebaudengoi]|nr:hypothetical protein C8J57DRAFT_1730225 [Mycena rebaudengoi]
MLHGIYRLSFLREMESQQKDPISPHISKLIKRIGAVVSDKQKQAVTRLRSRTNILDNTNGLTEIANILGLKASDSVTSSTMDALHADFESLLEQNRARFELKLRGTMMMLDDSIERSAENLFNKLQAGSHDLIDEPDIKQIWKDNNWKYAIKCRTFADALSNYYTEQFRNSPGDDAWTLKILGKVLYYPALGEAIDADASGFISVHEVGNFLKRNKDLSTPVWFAFSAVGPPALNYDYTDKIDEITEGLAERCQKLKTDDISLNMWIDEYLAILKLVECITDWNIWDVDADDGLEELDEETTQDLLSVAKAVSEKTEVLIEQNLRGIGYLVDQESLASLTGEASLRIEQKIMVLLYLVLRQHDKIISQGMGDMSALQFATKWKDMYETLLALIREFHQRFRSLERSWRSQSLDIELRVRSYAGGLFNGWYQEYNNKPSIIRKYLDPSDEDSDEDPDEETMDAKVDQLSKRITDLDARLDARLGTIESMLKQLVGAGIGAHQTRESGPTRGNVARHTVGQRAEVDETESSNVGNPSGEDNNRVPDSEDGGDSKDADGDDEDDEDDVGGPRRGSTPDRGYTPAAVGDQDSADDSSTQLMPNEGYGRNESSQPGYGGGQWEGGNDSE